MDGFLYTALKPPCFNGENPYEAYDDGVGRLIHLIWMRDFRGREIALGLFCSLHDHALKGHPVPSL